MKNVAVIGLVLAGLLAGTAHAEDDGPPLHPLPTSGAAHLPMVESLEPVAEAYWEERGIALPQPVEVFIAADEPGVGARGDDPGTRVWLTESLLGGKGATARAYLCTDYLHERGHNAGLAHESGDPVMEPAPSPPPQCVAWADRWGAIDKEELHNLWAFWRTSRKECHESGGHFRVRCFHELRSLAVWIRGLEWPSYRGEPQPKGDVPSR